MINYNQQLDILFDSWKSSAQKHMPDIDVANRFVCDGLMRHVPEPDSSWFSAKKRVAFLMKDKSDGTCDDVRNWLNDIDNSNNQKNRSLGNDLFKNIANILYALENDEFEFNNINDQPHTEKCLLDTPFAYVECKKIAGGGELEDKVLNEYLDRDREFLQMELEILRPNIIVCTHHLICSFVKSMYPSDELFVQSNNLAYHQKSNTLIILGYHPTARWISHLVHFYGTVSHYKQFIESPLGKEFLSNL